MDWDQKNHHSKHKGINIEKKLILSDDSKAGSGQKPLSLMGFIR
jgi:hypothetical protein